MRFSFQLDLHTKDARPKPTLLLSAVFNFHMDIPSRKKRRQVGRLPAFIGSSTRGLPADFLKLAAVRRNTEGVAVPLRHRSYQIAR